MRFCCLAFSPRKHPSDILARSAKIRESLHVASHINPEKLYIACSTSVSFTLLLLLLLREKVRANMGRQDIFHTKLFNEFLGVRGGESLVARKDARDGAGKMTLVKLIHLS